MAGEGELLGLHRAESPVAVGVGGDVTAATLRTAVERVATRLPARRSIEDEIIVVATDRYHFVVGLLAAWRRGHTVALPPNAQPTLLREYQTRPGVVALLHDTDHEPGLRIGDLIANSPGPANSSPEGLPASEIPLVRVFTSGSTGEHQRHEKSRRQLFDEAHTLIRRFAIPEGAVVVPTVPSHHIYGLLFGVLVPLLAGGRFLRETPLHATAVAAAVRDHGAQVLVSVPAHLRGFTSFDRSMLPEGLRIFSSGAPLPEDVGRIFRDRFGLRITEVLGSTETGGIATREDEGVWTPLPGIHVSCDAEGRMSLRSPFMPNPNETHACEDVIEMVSGSGSGSFLHLGRRDGVVKVGSKRVSLAEIEARLLAIPGVEDAAAIVREVEGARGVEPVVLVVAPGHSASMLRSELLRWLDPVVVPRRIEHVDSLPRAANGKLQRADLLALLERQPTRRPTARPLSQEEGTARFEVRIPKDLVTLRGHFTHHPIVAGVVQLDLAARLARGRWPDLGRLRRVLRLKFKRPMHPGDEVVLVLARTAGTTQVAFRFEAGDAVPMTTGTLDWETPPR